MYFRARTYDPSSGMFLQVDPIEIQSGTLGLYGYVGNNPTNFVDPTGHSGQTAELIDASVMNAAMAVGAAGVVYNGLINGPLDQIMRGLENPFVYSTSGEGSDTKAKPPNKGDQCGNNGPDPSWWEKRKKQLRDLIIPFMEILGLVTGYAEKGQRIEQFDDIVSPIEETRRKLDEWQEEDDDDQCR